MKFFTWSGKRSRHRIALLMESAKCRNVSVQILECRSLIDKISSLYNALRAEHSDELIVCSDAYDCLYLKGASYIEALLDGIGAKVLFSAQAAMDHHYGESGIRFYQESLGKPYFALNSGVIAGRVGELREMLREITSWNFDQLAKDFREDPIAVGHFNDQTLFGRYYARYPGKVSIDVSTRLSWTSAYEDDSIRKIIVDAEAQFCNPKTGEYPCIIHLPTTCSDSYSYYLLIAFQSGIPVTSSNVDLHRYRSDKKRSGNLIRSQSDLTRNIEKSPLYHLRALSQEAEYSVRRLMINLRKLGLRASRRVSF